MIKQLPRCFRLSTSEKQYIDSIKTNGKLLGTEWDKLKKKPQMIAVKASIRKKLRAIQKGCCAYCGNRFHVTSEDQIEHVAPKSIKLHPEFMFEEHNLVLACQYCNGFSKKGAKDTIDRKNSVYRKCSFKIIHPYFDNPDDHYSYTNAKNKVLIKFKTPKGEATINFFKLDGVLQSEARAKDGVFEIYKVDKKFLNMIDLVMSYKAS